MKETITLIVVLTVICLGAGALLALVNHVTAGPIREAALAEKLDAITKVLPAHDNAPDRAVTRFTTDNVTWAFYTARHNGTFAGAAAETVSEKGYGGAVSVMVGFNAQGDVHAIEILKQKETPGLGAKVTEPGFKKGFAGRNVKNTRWAVAKDGGEIDQITAATISSRAVVEAVSKAGRMYLDNVDRISRATDGASGQPVEEP